jgi:ribosomal protein S18 acetylase RimI-like enzyme
MPSPTSVSPERLNAWATGRGILDSSVANAEALWWAFAVARGHRVVDDPAWLVVDAGNDVVGTRVILRAPVAGALQLESLHRLIEGASRPVTVEDPFASIDLHAQGLVPRSLSVMGAGPLTPDAIPNEDRPDITVCRVQGNEGQLLDADQIVVAGFPRPTTDQAYRPGRMLPVGLLQMPDVSVFVADFLGAPCGACMTVKDTHGVGGVYWVAVLAEHRRAGIGRALMLAAMTELAGLPMVLSATEQGAPLYQKLGFETAIQSTWWTSSNRT